MASQRLWKEEQWPAASASNMAGVLSREASAVVLNVKPFRRWQKIKMGYSAGAPCDVELEVGFAYAPA